MRANNAPFPQRRGGIAMVSGKIKNIRLSPDVFIKRKVKDVQLNPELSPICTASCHFFEKQYASTEPKSTALLLKHSIFLQPCDLTVLKICNRKAEAFERGNLRLFYLQLSESPLFSLFYSISPANSIHIAILICTIISQTREFHLNLRIFLPLNMNKS